MDRYRALAHCTAHAAYEHTCPWCQDSENQVARATDTRTIDVMAANLKGAVEVDNAMVERFRESLWSTWGAGRQTTDWPTRRQLHAALDAAVGER